MSIEENKTGIEVLKVRVDNIIEDIKCFVTLDRFQPIEKIVWTLVMLLVTGIAGAVLKMVLK